MSFEMQAPNNESKENAIKSYYEFLPKGIRRDTEVAFNQIARYDYMKNEAPEDLRDLFEKISDCIEDSKDISALTEIILRAIRESADEEGWNDYDYNFDTIRNKLKSFGVTLKPKKTSNDYN
jgi:hypothetical protein